MEFTVTAKGATFEALVKDTARDLRSGNRKAGQELRKVGLKAMRDGAPRMWGRKLRVKADVKPRTDGCVVEFFPYPGNAGGWAIQESGHRGNYTVKPRRAKALAFGGRYTMVTHPNAWGGRKAWTKAGQRLAKVLDRTVERVYDDALGV